MEFYIQFVTREVNVIGNIGIKYIKETLPRKVLLGSVFDELILSTRLQEYMSWNRENAILIILLISCVLLWVFIQEISSSLNDEYNYYENIEIQRQELFIKNNALKLKLLENKSYTEISSEAAIEGFIKATYISF